MPVKIFKFKVLPPLFDFASSTLENEGFSGIWCFSYKSFGEIYSSTNNPHKNSKYKMYPFKLKKYT